MITFRVYEDSLVMIEEVREYRVEIAKDDPEQAAQLRRAAKSVAYNIAEGRGARGRNQQAKYAIALSEARRRSRTWRSRWPTGSSRRLTRCCSTGSIGSSAAW